MEEIIKEEIAQFKKLIDKDISEPIDFMNKLNLPILNALWKVTVGEKLDYEDKRLIDIVKRLTKGFEIFGRPSMVSEYYKILQNNLMMLTILFLTT